MAISKDGVQTTSIPVDKIQEVKKALGEYRVCAKSMCDREYWWEPKNGWPRKFCDVHLTTARKKSKLDYSNVQQRRCANTTCKQMLPKSARPNRKYCGLACRDAMVEVRQRQKKLNSQSAQALFREADQPVPQMRQGEVYEKLNADPLTRDMLLDGDVTASAVANQMGVSTAAVTRAMQGVLADIAYSSRKLEWEQSKRVRAMLPSDDWFSVRGMDPGDPEFDVLVDRLVRAYSVFSRRYFNLEGKRPLVKAFHTRWIRSIIVAAATGGKQLILSPPRHGKSEMLIRFVVWFIAMDPNIRIGWFCASRDVAELMLGAVKDILESNEQLIKDVLAPGELFDPGLKSNKPWSKKEIKVSQQSHIGAKSSSLLALGRTSKFLSRDMDIIVVDDLEDYDSTREESQRIYSRNKLAEIGTRKVEETCEVYIGSRQHPDDIPNLLLGLEDSILAWQTIVETAHEEDCDLDPDDFDAHVDCMLFPEVRSYRYLMEKKAEMDVLGLSHLYPLRYLNTPVPADGQVFDVPRIRDHLDRERGLGLDQLPMGVLAAGLDPSARGIQASFLWHYRDRKLSMVDLDATQSGGMEGAHLMMRNWHDKYGLTTWFYEDNSQQVEFFGDPRTKKLANELGLSIKPFRTGKNKMDPELGISTMAPMYHSGAISLPYGTKEARVKVSMLLRQLELWTTDGVKNKHAKTDIKMASWFPFPYFLDKMKGDRQVSMEHASEASYPGYTGTDAPWSSTQYPGG